MIQVLIALDQLLNTLFGGWADETLSARAYRNHATSRKWRFFMRMFDALMFWQANHCRDAHNMEVARRHLPHSYREVKT